MKRYERLNALLEILAEEHGIDVDKAAASLGVSAATIRRDLDHLAEQQLLTRTHGGAVANSTSYAFTVTATNSTGTSAASVPSAPVTPRAGTGALPAAPTNVSTYVDATDGRIAVTWTAPTTTGDTPIIGYTVSSPGLPTQTLAGRNAIAHSTRAVFTGLKPGTYTFTVSAQNAVGSGPAGSSTATTVTIPALSAVYSNVGTSDDTDTTTANIDGSGCSLSAQALAAAGVTPGGTVTAGGQSFTWPSSTPGTIDNTVASGQTITVPGSGSTLGFLVTSTYGTATGTGTITYTDGTTQGYTVSAPDWYSTPPVGSTTAITMTHRNCQTGPQGTHNVHVFYVGIALQSGKTVASITLPSISAAPDKGIPLCTCSPPRSADPRPNFGSP